MSFWSIPTKMPSILGVKTNKEHSARSIVTSKPTQTVLLVHTDQKAEHLGREDKQGTQREKKRHQQNKQTEHATATVDDERSQKRSTKKSPGASFFFFLFLLLLGDEDEEAWESSLKYSPVSRANIS